MNTETIIAKRNELEQQRDRHNDEARKLSQQIWEIDEALKNPKATEAWINTFIQNNAS